jgi:hypothetical protein
MEAEEWRSVKDFEGLYEVSNLGRVRSLDRIVTDRLGRNLPFKGKVISPANVSGYCQVLLTNQDFKKYKKVHRLVAEAFLENPLEYDQINHIDSDKSNNNVSNLEWCNGRQNCTHKVENSGKTLPVGVAFFRGKFTATFTLKQVIYHLGTFNKQKDAEELYKNTLANYLEKGIIPKKGVDRKRYCNYKGVYYSQSSGKYYSQCLIKGDRHSSQMFSTEDEAYEHLCAVKDYYKLYNKYPV